MVNIIQPIINRLDECFPEIPIELGNKKQGVKTPCFFVHLVSTELKRQLSDRFFLNNIVNINYASGKDDDVYTLEEMRFKMLTFMEQIQLEFARVTGDNLEAKIIDKDIVMTVHYNVWMEKVKAVEFMKYLEQSGNVKEKLKN